MPVREKICADARGHKNRTSELGHSYSFNIHASASRWSKLDDVTSNSVVIDTASTQTGGLAGVNGGSISNARASGSVSAGSKSQVGGLVGVDRGNTIIRHTWSTSRVAAQRSRVGGLVGVNEAGALIADSTPSGIVGGDGSDLGGLVAWNSGTIRSSLSGAN
ncbi:MULTISPECIES: GLUG motif-containing protein [Burkholderia]|uniref:GLUG motif-containing protein n=1 Tax=Burkholderia TaxID=32008 RepID=UPI000F66526D|nr:MULTISPECIES: GLUG motif-containing protein [Burkholderia]MBG0880229.1 hypothetical protein [Burkholderia sp. 9775_39]MBG0886338.1 hypothetical protein [Burkholderia sp. 9773_38]RSC39037.1 hypothetical protein EGT44_18220 [Burkholderia cenocepacia]